MARTSSKYTVCPQIRCIASFALMAPFMAIASASAFGSEVQHPELLFPASCVLCLCGFRGLVPGDGRPLSELVIDLVTLWRSGPTGSST